MLSHTCKSAIKSLVYLSSKFEAHKKSTIKDIASHIEVSEHTLGKLLQVLVKKNIICSEKGPSGGFYITKEQLKLPLIDIVEVIDGKDIFTECILGLKKCNNTKPCAIHHQYKHSRDLFIKLLNENKISDLGESVNLGITYLTN